MKRSIKNLGLMTTIIALLSFNVIAQPGPGNNQCRNANEGQHDRNCKFLPNLTEEQEAQIKELKLPHMKAVQDLQNQLNEKKARQQTLMTADKVDVNAINENIDEITGIMNKLMKEKAAHQQKVRALLTDEQKIVFDQNLIHKGKKGHKKGHNKAYNRK